MWKAFVLLANPTRDAPLVPDPKHVRSLTRQILKQRGTSRRDRAVQQTFTCWWDFVYFIRSVCQPYFPEGPLEDTGRSGGGQFSRRTRRRARSAQRHELVCIC